ncbi:hypothetical protein [Hydrogenophaga sp.]|uniref:hypothetical protein n=1 Tax=Hydrogenophaga sp. TaxID=1904254 RepID=UPI0026227EAB|nr:hypothetical protein [Hydrogenophaga sp.]MCW5653097.1 hypothetical protein [Hydrogenophaga sp.]
MPCFPRSHVLLSVALGALMLSGCVATGGSGQPAVARGAFGVPLGNVESSGTSSIKGENKVVLASFRVAFNQSVKASAQSSALFSANTASAQMKGKLLGVEPRVYQAIVDAAYADFVRKLRASGLTVVEPTALGSSPAYARLSSVPNPAALDSSTTGDVLMVAASGTKLTLFPGDAGVASGFSGFDTASPIRVFPDLIKEQEAGVMHVTYYVDFLNASSSGRSMVKGGNAEVAMGQGLSVRTGSGISYTTLSGSRCVGYCPNAISSVKLGQAVFSEQAYGVSKDVTDSSVNAIGFLSGVLSGQSFSRKDIEIHADPGRYSAITTQLLADTNSALIDVVKQSR